MRKERRYEEDKRIGVSSSYNIIMKDMNGINELEKTKLQIAAKRAVVELVESETTDINLNTVAMVRAKYDAYKTINKNFEKFVVWQSENLTNYADKPQIMLSLAKLCFDWLTQTKDFIIEAIGVLKEEIREK